MDEYTPNPPANPPHRVAPKGFISGVLMNEVQRASACRTYGIDPSVQLNQRWIERWVWKYDPTLPEPARTYTAYKSERRMSNANQPPN